MPLPKVSHPTFPILVPSLDVAKRFRPWTVKEEKILLMAKESSDPADHLRAVHQVVNNCVVSDDLNMDDLAIFDIEWLFLKLRGASVGSTVNQPFNDKEEANMGVTPLPVYDFTINLDDIVAPKMPEGWKGFKQINLDDNNYVLLRYPPASLYIDTEFVKNPGDAVLHRSTVSIFQDSTSYVAAESTQDEVIEYYDSWDVKSMDKVKEFLDSTPSMSYTIDYKNSFEHDRKVVLKDLTDFFTF